LDEVIEGSWMARSRTQEKAFPWHLFRAVRSCVGTWTEEDLTLIYGDQVFCCDVPAGRIWGLARARRREAELFFVASEMGNRDRQVVGLMVRGRRCDSRGIIERLRIYEKFREGLGDPEGQLPP